MEIKPKIEAYFENTGHILFENRFKALLIILLLTLVAISQLPKIRIDTSVLGMLHEDAQEIIDYNRFREQFGQDELIIIAVEAPDVLNQRFLKKLQRLHQELFKEVPYVSDITSLLNVRDIKGLKNELIVEDLFREWPATESMFSIKKERIFSNHAYQNTIIDPSGSFTAIVIEPQLYDAAAPQNDLYSEAYAADNSPDYNEAGHLTDAQRSELMGAIYRIAEKYETDHFRLYIAGTPALVHMLNNAVKKDMRKFLGLTMMAVALFLFIIFRRVSGMVLPLLVVVLSLLTTISIMGYAGAILKLPTSILPSFLLAVGVGDSVHVMAIFFRNYRRPQEKKQALMRTLGHCGIPIFVTSLTTAGGLLSLSAADLAPVADLGVYGSLGVMIAFAYSVLLLPVLISICPIKALPNRQILSAAKPLAQTSRLDSILARIADINVRRPKTVLAIAFSIIILAIASYPRLHFSYNSVKWFPETEPFRISVEKINDHLKGSLFQEIIVDMGRNGAFYEPEILKRLDQTAHELEMLRFEDMYVGKVLGLTLYLKEIHQALNENQKAYYRIPDNKELIAQEFLLYDMSRPEDIFDYTDTLFSKVRITLKLPYVDAVKQTRLLDIITAHMHKRFPEAVITYTGLSTIYCAMISKTASSMAKSYLIALAVISLLMMILLGNFFLGCFSMIPNITPIMIMLGITAYTDIPLDPFTMLVGGIAMGLCVDDTIHFLHSYKKYYDQSEDAVYAIRQTIHLTGRALLITTLVLSSGFFIFTFSKMSNINDFGILCAVTILLALLADFFMAPSLLYLIHRKKRHI